MGWTGGETGGRCGRGRSGKRSLTIRSPPSHTCVRSRGFGFRVEGGGREQREKDEGADPPLLTCVESGDTDFWSRRWVWVSEG